MNNNKFKPKPVELTKTELSILSALGEITNRLEDILKGCRRKFEICPSEFMQSYVNLMWRAPDIYNICYAKFGCHSRGDLTTYINQYLERPEISEVWDSLEDIEALWDELIKTISNSLQLNEAHEDKFIKYYFINTMQLYDLQQQDVVHYSSIFTKQTLVIMFPIYIPGTILINLMKEINKIEKEIYVFGMEVSIILFGTVKKAKLWCKQYKLNYENMYVDSSDEIKKARRNMTSVFCTKSMETIGLSSREKTKFLIADDTVNWQDHLFPGGIALANSEGTVFFEHLCRYLGDFPASSRLLDIVTIAFAAANSLSSSDTQQYLRDGMKYYIAPDFARMQYETKSGMYYDFETTLYYEPRSGYFYDGRRRVYLYWCKDNKSYLSVKEHDTEAIETGDRNVTLAGSAVLYENDEEKNESLVPGEQIRVSAGKTQSQHTRESADKKPEDYEAVSADSQETNITESQESMVPEIESSASQENMISEFKESVITGAEPSASQGNMITESQESMVPETESSNSLEETVLGSQEYILSGNNNSGEPQTHLDTSGSNINRTHNSSLAMKKEAVGSILEAENNETFSEPCCKKQKIE